VSGLQRSVHRRRFDAPLERLGALLDTLSTTDDRLWPRDQWPAQRLDRGLEVGSRGGHGPIRYTVSAYVPGRHVRYEFTRPRGFDGWHAFDIEPRDGGAELRHTIEMRIRGLARLTWPLIFRPLHDALLEDLLDRAALELGQAPRGCPWSSWVRVLRAVLRPRRPSGIRRAPVAS